MIKNVFFNEIEYSGVKINYNWEGDPENIKLIVYDGYSKLIYFEKKVYIQQGYNYYIIAPNPAKHKIFSFYDNNNILIYTIENFDSPINVSEKDPKGYFKDIGITVKENSLAIPLYEVFLYNLYNHNECKVEKGDIVFDVGSNVGMFTYHSLYNECSKVFAFEPNIELYNVVKNKGFLNVELINAAVSNEDGYQTFLQSEGGISSCLERNNDSIILEGDSLIRDKDIFFKTEVRTVNLMNYIDQNHIEKIDYLKCDCEGGEYDIIESLREDYLRNNIKKMLIEYHYLHNIEFLSKYKKMIEKIEKCGFQSYNNSDDSVVNDGVLFFWK